MSLVQDLHKIFAGFGYKVCLEALQAHLSNGFNEDRKEATGRSGKAAEMVFYCLSESQLVLHSSSDVLKRVPQLMKVLVDELQNIVDSSLDFVNDKSTLDLLEHLLGLYN
jgi:hypothetical protein